MDYKITIILWSAIILLSLDQAESTSCSTNTQIQCRSKDQCVSYKNVCNGRMDCNDGSDEDTRICKFWKIGTCSSNNIQDCRGNCWSHKDYCTRGYCREQHSEMCQLIDSGILYLKTEEITGMALTEGFVEQIQNAVNATSTNSTKYCPMFYTRVGDACLSFFSPAKIPWPEARQFCLAMGGDLVSLGKIADYLEVMAYMRNSKFTTNYWTGGRFDVDTNNWSWVGDDSTMPLGTPFWATRYKSSCVPRSPYTDPTSLSLPLPGAPCYNYVQAPDQRAAGWCASMTYEHYYYLTDESCQEQRSPLCIFTGRFALTRSEGPE